MRIGVVGCGRISGIYFQNLTRLPQTEVVRCADLDVARAKEAAERHGIAAAGTVEELLADESVELVVNLTIPAAHVGVGLAAVRAGKHVYAEKPLALTVTDARQLLEAATHHGVRVGSAPDTFLGAGLQTARALVDEGAIGRPLAGSVFMLSPGHEHWHPAPDFYYQPGGGPLFDMGPYYLTALVTLLGPVAAVTAAAGAGYPTRVTPQGREIPVEVPTHVTAVLEFASGAAVTAVFSFDVPASTIPHGIELYGSSGTLAVHDPNHFGGPVLVRGPADTDWREAPLRTPWSANSRGLGVAEMVTAIEEGRDHRASAALALHVLDTMETVHAAAARGARLPVATTVERPSPFLS
ncbi:Gfo/Idh/MocA family oxidoreductase [Asanoa sp. WMMD1127]|uniref:Gfo/Idh/MocA family protein n=1 Tax=Asanoa sp. WMMD1127 TaxID=3016107 RepID=UPI002416193A|nr:Gfo/Idh/MocA family oxidoreductase [Asanoa sp. WMMD1127]MDG4824769.1 Gfo/Idh/MocA family oxidoreductase [Asanoa sp. WMMD1127]